MRFDKALAALYEGKKVSFPGLHDNGRMLVQDHEGAIVWTYIEDGDSNSSMVWHPEPRHLQMDDWFIVGEDEAQ